jgi:hypothetical protein
MRHPSDGTLRRLLDDPDGVAAADREHAATCARCRSVLLAVQADATSAQATLGIDVGTDVDAAWGRLSRTLAEPGRRRSATLRLGPRWRAALRNPVVAGVAVLTLLGGAGAAAAANWLQIFRAEQIAPVTAPVTELITLPDLSDLGDVEVTEPVNVREVPDAATAQAATGIPVPIVSGLPRGVAGQPAYQVLARASATFTFSAEKAARFAAAAGGTAPPTPPGLDGSQFRFVAGPGVVAAWSGGRPVPALVVARIAAPTVYSTGIPFEAARDYVLSLPGVPPDVAAQLRSFSGNGTTLPLFTADENFTSSAADVNGNPATVLISRNSPMAGVVWVQDGFVIAVAGSLNTDEVLSVARGLRWQR